MDTAGSVPPRLAIAIAVLAIAVPAFLDACHHNFYLTGPLTYTADRMKCEAKKCELAVWIRMRGTR